MRRHIPSWHTSRSALAIYLLVTGVAADNILKTTSFTNCDANTDITVDRIDISYNSENKTVVFDIAGSSAKEQNVSAVLDVTAYGNSIYSNKFNPCDEGTFVEQLCPLPAGSFSARGDQEIPDQFADMVPSIAFQIPDIAAQAKLRLKSLATGENVACIQSQVSNGKTASVPAVSYIAAGVAGAALAASAVSAVGAAFAGGGSAGGAGTISPSFTEVFGWFQGMALNGMLSVNYPPVYRSFAQNFGFSTGLLSWPELQSGIDAFRAKTGGNLTNDSIESLKNATLIFPDGSTSQPETGFFKAKRAFDFDTFFPLASREIETSVGEDNGGANGDGGSDQGFQKTVTGIQAFAEKLAVPKSDTFMTVLLVVAIAIGATAVGILLVKVILELWALWGSFPKALKGFRKHYWGTMARSITTLILLFYGIWVLYCIFQFTQGDSWAAKALAGATLALFTAILAFFSYKIWSTARKLKDAEGDTSGLYEQKDIWIKYSLFYESYKKDYWWLFVPTIVYMFARGCILAAGDGHGMAQTIAQLVIEAIMLGLLLWSRPYERKSGNVINIVIQVVRVLSVACILVFVEEFGIRQTTQTVTGVVLIAVQSALTVVLVVLIAWNAINACCQANPHRKRRKEMEKIQRDMDALTPLDARNSLLLDRPPTGGKISMFSMSSAAKDREATRSISPDRLMSVEEGLKSSMSAPRGSGFRNLTSSSSNDGLMHGAVPPAFTGREPTLPNLGGGAYTPYGAAYSQYGGGGYRGY